MKKKQTTATIAPTSDMITRGVPADLRRELKVLAAREGRSMAALTIEAIRDLIEKYRAREDARTAAK